MITSGVRLGTPAVTTRGMGSPDMPRIAQWIVEALSVDKSDPALERIHSEVTEFCRQFPLFANV
jgi:glycine hydroxymethyltransferase